MNITAMKILAHSAKLIPNLLNKGQDYHRMKPSNLCPVGPEMSRLMKQVGNAQLKLKLQDAIRLHEGFILEYCTQIFHHKDFPAFTYTHASEKRLFSVRVAQVATRSKPAFQQILMLPSLHKSSCYN